MLIAQAPIFFVHNGGIGDKFCNLPTVRAIERIYGKRCRLLCAKGDKERFYNGLKFGDIIELKLQPCRNGWEIDIGEIMRKTGYWDLLICPNTWSSKSFDRFLTLNREKMTLGFSSRFSYQLRYSRNEHAIDTTFTVAKFLDPQLFPEMFTGMIELTDKLPSFVLQYFERASVSKKILCVHPESWNDNNKNWGIDNFCDVIDKFLFENKNFLVVFLGSKLSRSYRGVFAKRVLHFEGNLHDALRVLQSSDIFLGIDSCMLHAADLNNTPAVGLFGPTRFERWGLRLTNRRYHIQAPFRDIKQLQKKDVCLALRFMVQSLPE